jgi:lysophospholipase L1-like esterase
VHALDVMPAFPAGCKVIFQGDEITAGDHWPATKDFNHNFGQSYVCLIASEYGKLLPENKVVFLNQGVAGNTVSDQAARWQKDTIDAQPDLLSILIGGNGQESTEEFTQRYDKLLADTRAALPKVHMFLCEPFMLPSPDSAMAARIKVVAQLAAKYHATVVPLQRAFEDAFKRHSDSKWWLSDGRHPTAAGEQILADAWVRTAVVFYQQKPNGQQGGGAVVPPVRPVDELPVFPVGSRILFQGDSITDGRANGSSEFGQCYPYFIAAKFSARHPERKVTFINHGISGNKVSDLAARWQKDTLDVHPDLLSISIGINDGNNIEELEPKNDKLLADTIAALPNTQLVICEMIARPFNDPDGTSVWSARTKLVARLGEKYHIPVAHFQQAMNNAYQRYGQNDYWIWDGVHPSAAGQRILADEWLRTVAPLYRNKGVK